MPENLLHSSVSPLIQTALTPVFLLGAISTTLVVIDTRQNRIFDRVRLMEARIVGNQAASQRERDELAFYLRRAGSVGWAAVCCVISGMSVALAVVALFVDVQVVVSLAIAVEIIFTLAVTSYVLALVIYLRDILHVNRGMAYIRDRVADALAKTGAPLD